MAKTPFISGANEAYSMNVSDNRLINLYAEKTDPGAKEIAALFGTPGLRLLATIGDGPCRGFHEIGAYLYMVSGAELYRIDTSYAETLLGTVSGTGPVSMDDNGIQVFIAANPDGYIYNTSTAVFAQITDPDFPGASKVGYLDGYFLFIEPNSQRLWLTSLLDGTAIDPLDFASAEGAPDNIVSMIVDHREAWFPGTDSTEVYYNSGDPDFALTRMQGAFIEHGCAAADSVCKGDNSVIWLGKDKRGNGIVWRADGYTPSRISKHPIENEMRGYATLADATAYTYQQNGHLFYMLSFPTGNATWVYDASTTLWHERAYMEPATGYLGRHRSQCHAFFNNMHIVGDHINGKLYELDLDTYSDAGDALKCVRSWRAFPPGKNEGKTAFHNSLKIDCETGVGLVTGQGSDPQMMLRYSDDGGHTWGNEQFETMGAIGTYSTSAEFSRLGSSYNDNRVYEVSVTDPVKRAFIAANLDYERGE